ncbi:hypothetical protein [Pendulispora albinea]|uniref:OmpA-like domain-containing protein n=1 Tax=Pendulispora albinea TaxID=2741071 RepID=A0ABZ2M891_9BACT
MRAFSRSFRLRLAASTLATCTLLALATGCGGAAATPRGSFGALDAVERARSSPGAREGAALAPQEYGVAERERALAKKAHDEGDDVAARLYADHAIAAYEHAAVLARLARAQTDETKAQTARSAAQADARRLSQARIDVDREGAELDRRLTLSQEALVPSSRPADPLREAARLQAARSLATQARLLCGAARLLSPNLEGLAGAEKEAADLEKKLESSPKPAPIDAATHARVACLTVLTKVRRSEGRASAGQADALLAELSAAGSWSPVRDERGVVVTLRDTFSKSSGLTADGEAKLKELGRVLGAHPGVAVQVVVHDAAAPSAQEAVLDKQRADNAAKALASAANSTRVHGETAGSRAPLVDPSDAKLRARNARLDIVFVTPTD